MVPRLEITTERMRGGFFSVGTSLRDSVEARRSKSAKKIDLIKMHAYYLVKEMRNRRGERLVNYYIG